MDSSRKLGVEDAMTEHADAEEVKIEAEVVQEASGSAANEVKARIQTPALEEDVDVGLVQTTEKVSEVEVVEEAELDLKAEAFPPLPLLERPKIGQPVGTRLEPPIKLFR